LFFKVLSILFCFLVGNPIAFAGCTGMEIGGCAIYFKNNTSVPIIFSVYYQILDSKTEYRNGVGSVVKFNRMVMNSNVRLEPHEFSSIVTNRLEFYFYGETGFGERTWGGNNIVKYVDKYGKELSYPMREFEFRENSSTTGIYALSIEENGFGSENFLR
jgi:hypothetical protein